MLYQMGTDDGPKSTQNMSVNINIR